MIAYAKPLRRGKHWPRGPYPLGTIRERQNGKSTVRMVKVAMGGEPQHRWMDFARWWWLKNRGPIPEGRLVYHRDGNSMNDDPANFALGDNGDVIRAAHASNPDMSRRNLVARIIGCQEHNRLRGRIARATGCPSGGLVLDPFAGIGTTIEEAVMLGRRGIGIELSPKYAGMALTRIHERCGLLAGAQS